MSDQWFAELYETSYRRIVVATYGLVGDVGDAEELAQEAFAIAYSRRRRVQATDNPEAWLYTVAINLARRRWRRRATLDDPGDGRAGTTVIVGAYPVRGEISRRLLDALPVVLRVDADATSDAVLAEIAAEVAVDAPGQQVVLDRLLDWVLVCALREWFDRPDTQPPSQRDPVVGRALRLLHAQPAAPWTVATLADRTGVSRSTLAKRFHDLVGEPPLTYLTRLRMTLAADLLIEQQAATIADIARTVGYSDAFGFSAAFKRIRGVNPSEYRRTSVLA